ncbi:hypothetical protein [Jeotgalicoccus marinus]|uniref:hypothetical protein n=1 Tax=Jeotgalicoccus marinus TaxID=516700 RepID=UPI000479F321|nr:hypothetical protein [Jeotgalicoccus marinus]
MSRAIRKTRIFEIYDNGRLLMEGSTSEIAKQIGRSQGYVTKLIRKPTERYTMREVGTKEQVFAFYIGERFIATGTLDEIAEVSGETLQTLKFIRSNVAEERNLHKKLIVLEGETVIQRKGIKEKYAPKTVKERKEQIQVYKTRPVAPVEWNPSKYSKHLFDQCFKGWG